MIHFLIEEYNYFAKVEREKLEKKGQKFPFYEDSLHELERLEYNERRRLHNEALKRQYQELREEELRDQYELETLEQEERELLRLQKENKKHKRYGLYRRNINALMFDNNTKFISKDDTFL